MQDPGAILATTEHPAALQRADRARDSRTMGADEIGEPLVRKRQGHGNAIGKYPAPAFRDMPQGQQQAVIDPLVVRNRK